jgi:hypothetical protein
MPFNVNNESDIGAMDAKGHGGAQQSAREFSAVGNDSYRLRLPSLGITFDVDRIRRERDDQLVGELTVRCDLPGVRTIEGTLSVADFNFSSQQARSTRAKHLDERAGVQDIDWPGLVEELCQRVIQADRAGQPAIDLRTLPVPDGDNELEVEGLRLLQRHPTILFGDGGAAKSYLGLYLAGRLAERGLNVALFDWELAGEDHRLRLGQLFPNGMPRVLYVRCERALVYEVDRLRRIVRESDIRFSVFDSVAFACDGPPEAAEIAGKYFRAVRQIGGGSLHIAHISKSDNADQKPFGSTFWHNGARSTWFIAKSAESADSEVLKIGLHNRKANLGRLRPPIGFNITFDKDRTTIRPAEVADTPDLAKHLTVKQRMYDLLRRGPMTAESLAAQIDAKVETVTRTADRHNTLFTKLTNGSLALRERNRS